MIAIIAMVVVVVATVVAAAVVVAFDSCSNVECWIMMVLLLFALQ